MTAHPSTHHSSHQGTTGALPGKYLTFTLSKESYGIPVLKVREIIRLCPITPVANMPEHVKGVINLRGKVIPLVDLRSKFCLPISTDTERNCIVVVVEAGQDSRCLLVDQLIGKQEVVIKSLGEMFRHQTEFAGAAILGDGRVGLILDINALVKLKSRNGEAA